MKSMKTTNLVLVALLAILLFGTSRASHAMSCSVDFVPGQLFEGRHARIRLHAGSESQLAEVYAQDLLTITDIYHERLTYVLGDLHPAGVLSTFEKSLDSAASNGTITCSGLNDFGIILNDVFGPLRWPQDGSTSMSFVNKTQSHEYLHLFDKGSFAYMQGFDNGHAVTNAFESLLFGWLGHESFPRAAPISGDASFKSAYRRFTDRYLSDPNLTWDSYFSEAAFADIESTNFKLPEIEERVNLQAGFFMDLLRLHGEDGLRNIYQEVNAYRATPEGAINTAGSVLTPVERHDNLIRFVADGLQLNIIPYLEHWKFPISAIQRQHLEQYPQSAFISDTDGDGISALAGDFDDADLTVYPLAPELIDNKDNNQNGMIDENVYSEATSGFGQSLPIALPAVVQGTLATLGEEDSFAFTLDSRARVSFRIWAKKGPTQLFTFENTSRQISALTMSMILDGDHFAHPYHDWNPNSQDLVKMLDAGEHTFRVYVVTPNSSLGVPANPGDYEIQIMIDNYVPQTIEYNGLIHSPKHFDNLAVDPDLDCTNARGASAAECNALKNIHSDWNGTNWQAARGWITNTDVCYWGGIRCGQAGVVMVDLKGAGVNGEFAQGVFSLPHLRFFRAGNSDFNQSQLPDQFSQLPELRKIELRNSNLSGNLPESIGGLTHLNFLSFVHNSFAGMIPPSYKNLVNVDYLSLPAGLCAPSQAVYDWARGTTYFEGTHPDHCAEFVVSVEQASTQTDPAFGNEVVFDVVFDRTITGFTAEDLSLSGSAGPTTATITEVEAGKIFTVTLSGMTQSGTVSLSIPANVAQDANGNGNLASESLDNLVEFTHGPLNRPPVLEPIGGHSVGVGSTLTITLNSSDPDGDSLSYTVPAGLSANASFVDNGDGTAVFIWTPTIDEVGSAVLEIVVSDNGNPVESDSESVSITINEANKAPVLEPIGAQSVDVGSTLTITLNSSDPDGDSLSYTVPAGLSANASFVDNGDGTAVFIWTPTIDEVGSALLEIVVSDNGNPVESDSESVSITINEANKPPVLEPIGGHSVEVGSTLTLTLNSSDPDGDSLSYAVPAGLSANASFVDNGDGSAVLSWTPTIDEIGSALLEIVVSDNGNPVESDSESVSITINEFNTPPVLEPIGGHSVEVGSTLTLTLNSSDPDGDSLSYAVPAGLSANASFVDNGDGTAVLSWTPTIDEVGSALLEIVVSDNGNPVESDSESVSITINEFNTPPVLEPIGQHSVEVGSTLTLTLNSSDPDGDSLSYAIPFLPDNASFVDNGDGTAVFIWTPTMAQVGGSFLDFVVSDNGNPVKSDSEFVFIGVNELPPVIDTDFDSIADESDNCQFVANTSQLDTDGDGYGNACDADFNNDCVVNFLDMSAFSGEFLGTNALYDINGDSVVNFLDLSTVAGSFLSQPGPGLGSCSAQ